MADEWEGEKVIAMSSERFAELEAERDRLREALVEVREWARGRNQMLYMLTLEALNKVDTKEAERVKFYDELDSVE